MSFTNEENAFGMPQNASAKSEARSAGGQSQLPKASIAAGQLGTEKAIFQTTYRSAIRVMEN